MTEITIVLLAASFLIIIYYYLLFQLEAKTKKHKNEIEMQLEAISIEKLKLQKFHYETLTMINENEIANKDLTNQNKLFETQINKLKNELHHARQKSKRLAKMPKNVV